MATSLEKKVVFPPAGKYILAVSGGIDSVTLLDIFAKAAQPNGYDLLIAHFDHGIRKGSRKDRKFVQRLAKQYQLPFRYAKTKLGIKATEAAARMARYAFLSQLALKHQAMVVTAQHADDLVETILFYSGRKSQSRPFSNKNILRPFINIYRSQIEFYASQNKLRWHEDHTNQDLTNTRNFIRQVLLPYLEGQNKDTKQQLLKQHQETIATRLQFPKNLKKGQKA